MSLKISIGGVVILAALAGLGLSLKHHDVSFHRLQEAQTRLLDLGYYCTTDSAGGQLGCGFMITRAAINWTEVGGICKSGPMGPEWEGKVWVTLNPKFWQLESIPDQAGVRVWGAVVAFGDESLLREIDNVL